MIKQLVSLVMPTQLSFVGVALGAASLAFSVYSSLSGGDDIETAQKDQAAIENKIREEQAFRERRKQVRTANVLTAQAQAVALASGSGRSSDTSISGVSADISGNLSRNLGEVNFALQTGAELSAAQTNVANAGRPSTASIFNKAAQPFIFNNIDAIDSFFSPPPTPPTT